MGNGTFEKRFMDWLSGQISPSRFPECARTYKEIEDFCLNMKIISTPLFEIRDYTAANQIRQVVGKNQAFRIRHKKAIWKYEAAANYLCKYFKIMSERAESDAKATSETMIDRAFSETAIGRVRRTKKLGDSAEISTSSKLGDGIERVLETHYKYGFKYNSIRELMRFRQFADGMNITVPQDDNQLQEAILAAGTVIDGKVYYKSVDIYHELQIIVEDIFSSGIQVIYYESLLMVQSEWMSFRAITSAEMLKEYTKVFLTMPRSQR